MPTYDYRCRECGKKFTLTITVAEHDKGVKCPKCNSREVDQLLTSFFAKTRRKS
ncbi:MAG: zinc ribbon domain-containing protein [bacterium]